MSGGKLCRDNVIIKSKIINLVLERFGIVFFCENFREFRWDVGEKKVEQEGEVAEGGIFEGSTLNRLVDILIRLKGLKS